MATIVALRRTIPDPGPTLDQLHRAYIEVELEPRRFSSSVLIDLLVRERDPIERGRLIRELAGEQ